MRPPLTDFVVPENIAAARHQQDALREKLILSDDPTPIRLIAGVDCGYDVQNNLAHASIVTMTLENLTPIEQVTAYAPATFPYIPGFLSFREVPTILAAISLLQTHPDLWMVDGQGIAHPRHMGIAAHLGALLDAPTIGVAKSRLAGDHAILGSQKGAYEALMLRGEPVGYALRSKQGCNPLFISPGHRVSVESALRITQRCLKNYRLPEPTRWADKFSKIKHENVATPELDLFAG